MQSKSETENQLKSNSHSFTPNNAYSEPWWRGIQYNPVPQAMLGVNASNSSSLERLNGDSESSEDRSLSNNGLNEEDDNATKESQPTAPRKSGNYGQDHQAMQHSSSPAPSVHDDYLTEAPQLDLVGHSIVGYAPFIGMPHARMALPLEMAQEPVYVNAKQYQGILRRRQARAKAELEKKLIKVRKPYLHESRHQHAMRRARGNGGRFAKKTEVEASNHMNKENDKGSDPVPSSQSINSSGFEPLPSDCAETWNSNVQQDARGSQVHERFEEHNYADGRGSYHNHNALQSSSAFSLHSGERVEEGDCSGQQRGSISSEHTSQRRLAIQ
ncbi:nuclear transcription factor Y subunit A-1 [Cajanus cajan]|uniref:nuclear transcription factor Y subunit A-1 n=1 Tax=Cajanus cajan TaxID=3821 RepID=UPI00098D8F7F|nr:nuclear transcription factor Y subunit A-1 [Cajanus cajan]XP_020209676.1 nuclear transcription factor Y subunit A-1 [Cajanus cajan]XP_029124839.1 nuclear transcription factor Y subunit A-1 [Cajanus cajan]